MPFGIHDQNFHEVLNRVETVESFEDISSLWGEMARLYEVKTIAYFGTGLPGMPEKEPYISVTYPADWVEHYKRQGYIGHDPVILEGFRKLSPMDWSELSVSSPMVKRIFGEAGEFGLGRQGLTIPVRGRGPERALFSVTADVSNLEWRRMRRYLTRDFQIFALRAHEQIIRVNSKVYGRALLSRREIQCLYWASQGKTAAESSMILDLSERTIKFYLENARNKLKATNNTQAVAKAMKLSLL